MKKIEDEDKNIGKKNVIVTNKADNETEEIDRIVRRETSKSAPFDKLAWVNIISAFAAVVAAFFAAWQAYEARSATRSC